MIDEKTSDVENEDTTQPVEPDTTEESEDVFTRAYVETLRDENAKLRVRAQGADELRHRLHFALVERTGLLADPSDLEYSEDHLADPESLTGAIDALLESKPHLRNRTPRGDVGQGVRGAVEQPASLLSILKNFT